MRSGYPIDQRVGDIDAGWTVANATLSGERQMVAGSGSGGVDRIGGSGTTRLIRLARQISTDGRPGGWDDPVVRQELMRLAGEERIRSWTNQRVRARATAGRGPGPESSVGKVHQGDLNQRVQRMATDLLGAASTAWLPTGSDGFTEHTSKAYASSLPYEVRGMLRSRANTIEGGTTEVNKNIIAERVLGLPPNRIRGTVLRGATCLEADDHTVKAYDTLLVTREGSVGWLVFNRPDAGNAMNATMLGELESAWAELDADPGVRVIVNTGQGRSFQTGLDMVQLSRDPDALREQSRRTKRAELRLTAWHNQVRKPVIVAVNGTCAGGGLHFVADADIVLAATDASFVDPHVSVGQVTAYETIGLARKSPMEPVFRMALVGSGGRMSAERARQLGIVGEIAATPDALRIRAQALAESIAQNSPTAMAATKRALWGALELGLTDACRAGSAELLGMWGHPDQEEGPRAFVEKRPPRWEALSGSPAIRSEE